MPRDEEHLHIHHHIHVDPDTLEFFRHLQKDMHMLRDKLSKAIAASQALVTSETSLNASITAYVNDEPNRTKSAVASALEAAGVEEDAAADLITQAGEATQSQIDASLAAITANTGTGGDTTTDTVTGGTDTLTGGNAGDSIDPNAQ